jgi:hypothetical protein
VKDEEDEEEKVACAPFARPPAPACLCFFHFLSTSPSLPPSLTPSLPPSLVGRNSWRRMCAWGTYSSTF